MKTPFQDEMQTSLGREFDWVYHPPDTRGEKFTPKKPADFICCFVGALVLVEVKATREGRFRFRDIPQHQREALTTVSFTSLGGSFIAINFRAIDPGCAWFVPWGTWVAMENATGKKSISLREMPEFFPRCEMVYADGWVLGESWENWRFQFWRAFPVP